MKPVARSRSIASFMSDDAKQADPNNYVGQVYNLYSRPQANTSRQPYLKKDEREVAPAWRLDKIRAYHLLEPYMLVAFTKKMYLARRASLYLRGEPEPRRIVFEAFNRACVSSRFHSIPRLMGAICADFFMLNNAFLYMPRDKKTGQILFVDLIPPTMITAAVNSDGVVKAWLQKKITTNVNVQRDLLLSSEMLKRYDAADVVHFTQNRWTEEIFGAPSCIPVLADIDGLRQLEVDVHEAILETAWPLTNISIKLPESGSGFVIPTVRDEVTGQQTDMLSYVKGLVENHSPKDKMVTTNTTVTTANPRIDSAAMELVKHMKERVLAGLHLSSLDVGEASSATRNTGAIMNEASVQNAEYILSAVRDIFNGEVIPRFLETAALLPEKKGAKRSPHQGERTMLTEPPARVRLEADPIDRSEVIAWQAHIGDMYSKNVIPRDRAFELCKMAELSDEDRKDFYVDNVNIPLEKAKAKEAKKSGALANKARPANQHGTHKPRKDSFVANVGPELEAFFSSPGKTHIEQLLSKLYTELGEGDGIRSETLRQLAGNDHLTAEQLYDLLVTQEDD